MMLFQLQKNLIFVAAVVGVMLILTIHGVLLRVKVEALQKQLNEMSIQLMELDKSCNENEYFSVCMQLANTEAPAFLVALKHDMKLLNAVLNEHTKTLQQMIQQLDMTSYVIKLS